MPDLEVRGSGNGWLVLHEGRRISRVYHQHSSALSAIKGIEARLRRARARIRPCLCCTRPFPSQGPHHRMCDPCRRDA